MKISSYLVFLLSSRFFLFWSSDTLLMILKQASFLKLQVGPSVFSHLTRPCSIPSTMLLDDNFTPLLCCSTLRTLSHLHALLMTLVLNFLSILKWSEENFHGLPPPHLPINIDEVFIFQSSHLCRRFHSVWPTQGHYSNHFLLCPLHFPAPYRHAISLYSFFMILCP